MLKFGLTFDLRNNQKFNEDYPRDYFGEFDTIDTIQYLENTLIKIGYNVDRIGNIESLVKYLTNGNRVDFVFNIAEGIQSRSRESQIPCLLDAFNIPYTFSDPLTLALTLDKGVAKRVLKSEGIPTPKYFIANSEDIDPNIIDALGWPLFVKPIHEGTSKGINSQSIVESTEQLKKQVACVIKNYKQPALIEEYLPGREFTVGLIGTGKEARVLGILEINILDESNVYGFDQKEECETQVFYELMQPSNLFSELSEIALSSYSIMECRDAGRVDIRLDKNQNPQIIEINPIPGLHPTHSDLPIISSQLGLSYEDLISEILHSALTRYLE
jgi:D-alanine-D-alanine ligase